MCKENPGDAGHPLERADAAEAIADYAAGLRFADLPRPVVVAVKASILDTIGCVFAGTARPDVQRIHKRVIGWGGTPSSSIFGGGGIKLPPVAAVLANGSAIHQYDFDDTHDRATCHPTSSSLIPALAVAEERGAVSGQELIAAVACGNEITSRVSAAVQGTAHDFPWFRAPVVGLFGATAAAAKIMGASRDQHVEALGLALPMVGGTFASLFHAGSSVRSVRDGLAYRNGVLAAALAIDGLRGDKHVFDGPYGYYKCYFNSKYDRAELVDGLGQRHEAGLISLKPWPSCRHVHGALTALLDVMRRERLSFDQIASVTVEVGRINITRCRPLEPDDDGHIDLLCNLPFALANAILHGGMPLAVYQDKTLSDAVIAKALPKIHWRQESRQDGNWTFEPGRVEVLTTAGVLHKGEALIALGHPQNPMSASEQEAKFLMNTENAARPLPAARARRIIDLVGDLENQDTLDELMRCLQ